MRRLTTCIMSALACLTMVACGSEAPEALPETSSVEASFEGDKTIDLNNAAEHDAWDDEMNNKCPISSDGTHLDCKQRFMEGTTLLLKGPVVAADTAGDMNFVSIGSNNPRFSPIPAPMITDPAFSYVAGSYMCPESVPGCSSAKVGDYVSLVVEVERRPIPNISDPSVGMYVTSIEIR